MAKSTNWLSFSLWCFLYPPVTSPLLGLNIPFNTPFSNTLSVIYGVTVSTAEMELNKIRWQLQGKLGRTARKWWWPVHNVATSLCKVTHNSHALSKRKSIDNSLTVPYVQGKMRVWCVALLVICLVNADRDARWLLPGTDFAAVVHERRTVTQTTMSSCVVVAPSLEPCSRPDVAPTAPTQWVRTSF